MIACLGFRVAGFRAAGFLLYLSLGCRLPSSGSQTSRSRLEFLWLQLGTYRRIQGPRTKAMELRPRDVKDEREGSLVSTCCGPSMKGGW